MKKPSNLRLERQKAGMTISDVAALTGFSPATISNVERGIQVSDAREKVTTIMLAIRNEKAKEQK